MNTRAIVFISLTAIPLLACKSRDERMSKLAESLNSAVVAPGKIGNLMVIGDTDLTGNRNVAGGIPELSTGGGNQAAPDVILSRSQFVIAFDSNAKVPAWTSWQVNGNDLGSTERSDRFQNDEILDTFLEIRERSLGLSPKDYANTCFDKGHQSPAADRSQNRDDNDATFYMSNMAPQTAFLNRRPWKDLESYSRTLVKDGAGKLQIFAGPILRDGREGIGPRKDIQVPEAFFKVVAIYDNGAAKPSRYVAAIMPNLTAAGLDPLAEKSANCDDQKRGGGKGKLSVKWQDYKTSLAEVESKTGLRFPGLGSATAL
jgi:endonuclease G